MRRAELDSAGNEFIGAIDAQKNQAHARRVRRRLKQLEDDASARKATSNAALAVVQERRNKARGAGMERAGIIDNLIVKAPSDGVVSVKENRDGQHFFFTGMVLPQYAKGIRLLRPQHRRHRRERHDGGAREGHRDRP